MHILRDGTNEFCQTTSSAFGSHPSTRWELLRVSDQYSVVPFSTTIYKRGIFTYLFPTSHLSTYTRVSGRFIL